MSKWKYTDETEQVVIRTLPNGGNESRFIAEIADWIAEGNTPDTDDTYFPRSKLQKIEEYKTEGIKRIGLQVVEWNSFNIVALLASIWNMLGPPSAAQTQAKDIYVYVKNTAIPYINSIDTGDQAADILTIQEIDVINDVNWP